jgi:4'-phosphopantetheinyl transferase
MRPRPPAEVRVWHARRSHWDPRLERLLDARERARLRALRWPADRERSGLAAALLRLVAARELGDPPERLLVGRRCRRCGGPHGKPALQGELQGELQVSVSHAAEVVLVATAWHDPVGVDVEPLDPALPVDDLAPLCLAPEEARALAGLTGPERARAFLGCWTRKEAALGTFVTEVSVAAGYVAAVAVAGPPRPVAMLDAGSGGSLIDSAPRLSVDLPLLEREAWPNDRPPSGAPAGAPAVPAGHRG